MRPRLVDSVSDPGPRASRNGSPGHGRTVEVYPIPAREQAATDPNHTPSGRQVYPIPAREQAATPMNQSVPRMSVSDPSLRASRNKSMTGPTTALFHGNFKLDKIPLKCSKIIENDQLLIFHLVTFF